MTDEDALKAAKKRYKTTVQLPKTDFPMKAGLQQREPERQKKWADEDLYGRIRQARKDAAPWVLHDGPPYANGDAHTGTGMNKILKDMVVKFRTMQGYDVPYVPGWDCHGLPIEHNVLKELGGKKPDDMSNVKLRELCLEYANRFVDKQREQFKSAGVLGRWDDPYLTTSPRYEANVLRVFRDLVQRGYITRAKRPVHWSWAAQSALAEAELEYEDREDPSIYVGFRVAPREPLELADFQSGARRVAPALGAAQEYEHFATPGEIQTLRDLHSNAAAGGVPSREDHRRTAIEFRESLRLRAQQRVQEQWREGNILLVIWTTTPWTLPANRAVAVHPDAEYVLIAHPKHSLIVAADLAPMLFRKMGMYQVEGQLSSAKGDELVGLTYQQPMWGTECPVVTADYVTLEDGTGLVHTAPGHGKEDFETGKKEGIPPVCPVSANGTYYKDDRLRAELELPEDYEDANGWFEFINGKHILKVNDGIVEKLREDGLLLHSEPYPHSYPHCWRTHTPVIFRVTEQWFVNVDHIEEGESETLRQRILDEIKKVQWFPAWGEKRISAMVENRPDWCISRQRNWGIPIPGFLDEETGETCMTVETVDHIVDLVEQHGSNVWYDDENWPVDKLLPDAVRPEQFKGKALKKMDDIFDVWFESGASHRAVMLADDELKDKFPAGLYLEGDDQHRGWFQVSLILSVATQGRSPFKQCLTSAFVVDENGEKGSKSKGNIWPIDKGVKDLGADLIRLYFAGANTSEPIPVTYDLVRGAGDAYRKLRNTWRALVGNLFDFEPDKHAVPYDDMGELDRWAISQCQRVIEEVTQSWERYEFHTSTRALVYFANVTLSAQYVDVCKDRLYCETAEGNKRRSTQTAYWVIAEVLMRLMAPVLAHTVEEMWEHFPHWPGVPDSAHLAWWPTVAGGGGKVDAALDAKFGTLFKIKAESDRILDRLRKDKQIGKGYDTNVTLGLSAGLAGKLSEYGTPEELALELAEVLNVSRVQLDVDSDHGALQDFEPAADVPGLWVKVDKSDEEACVRCYRRTGDVGRETKHERLCLRCATVVGDDA